MVATLQDLLKSMLKLLDKFYLRKQSDEYNMSGVVVTDENKNIVTRQSIPANSSMISGLSTVATSGEYSDLDNKPLIDTSSGGTNGSTNLITSGAVYSGLNPLIEKYDGVVVRNSTGNPLDQPFFRLFRLSTINGNNKNASLVFEIIGLMSDGCYAEIKLDIRQSTSSAYFKVTPLVVWNFNLDELWFAFNPTYNNNYLDVYFKIVTTSAYIIRIHDGHSRDGNTVRYTQFAPVQLNANGTGGEETYASIENADILINGGTTYESPVKQGEEYNITADKFVKKGGTSSQFLKADGTVDSKVYSESTHTHNYIPSNSDGSTTGNLSATGSGKGVITANKFVKNGVNNTNILLANGNDLAQSTFSVSGHGHGDISNGGTMSSSVVGFDANDCPIVSDKSNSYKLQRGYISSNYIKDEGSANYDQFGLEDANKTQKEINSAINTSIADLKDDIGDVVLALKDNTLTYQLPITFNTNYVSTSWSFCYLTKVGRFCFVECGFVSENPLPSSGNSIYDEGFFKIGKIMEDEYIPDSGKYFDINSNMADKTNVRLHINGRYDKYGNESPRAGEVWLWGAPTKEFNAYGSGIYSYVSTYHSGS